MAMPPFWSLGFHLCREADSPDAFWNTFRQMEASNIPYDSDCIDLRLSGPGAGGVDTAKFPQALDQREALRDANKKFVMAQPPHMVELTNRSWITAGQNETEALAVKRFKTTVFLPSYPENPDGPFYDWDAIYQPEGVHLVDNRPLDEQSQSCPAISGVFVPEKLKASLTNLTLCSTAYHPSLELDHLAVHSEYGVQHLESWVWQTYGYPRAFYSNRASAWGNLGWAAHPGDDYTANWLAMQASLVQVSGNTNVTLYSTSIGFSRSWRWACMVSSKLVVQFVVPPIPAYWTMS